MKTDGFSARTVISRAARGIGAIFCAALSLLLVCNLTLILKGAVNPDSPPSVFGVTPLVVLSGSMSGEREGHIETGDLVLVRGADPNALAVGDVIAFRSEGTTVTHRITAVSEAEDGSPLFTTKGDANNAEDTEPVAARDVVGVYLLRVPGLGDFALFLREPLGMLLFIGVPLFAFLIYDILRRQRSARREDARTAELEAELSRLRELSAAREEAHGAAVPDELSK